MQAFTDGGCPEAAKEVSGAREHDEAYEAALNALSYDMCPLTVLFGLVFPSHCTGCGECMTWGVYFVLVAFRKEASL